MNIVKFHKFIANYPEVKDTVKTEIYVNADTISWFEEVKDHGRWHCTLYVGNEDFIEVLENMEETLSILGCRLLKKEEIESKNVADDIQLDLQTSALKEKRRQKSQKTKKTTKTEKSKTNKYEKEQEE